VTTITLLEHPAGLVDCCLMGDALWVLDPAGHCTAYRSPAGGWGEASRAGSPATRCGSVQSDDESSDGALTAHPLALFPGPEDTLMLVGAEGLLLLIDARDDGDARVVRSIPLPAPVLSSTRSPAWFVLALGTAAPPVADGEAAAGPGVLTYFAASGRLAHAARTEAPAVALGFDSTGRYLAAVWGGEAFAVCDLARHVTVSVRAPGAALTLSAGTHRDVWVAGMPASGRQGDPARTCLTAYAASEVFRPGFDPAEDAACVQIEDLQLDLVACALDTDPFQGVIAAGGVDGSLCVLDPDGETLVDECVHGAAVVRSLFVRNLDLVISAAMDGGVRLTTWEA
jgi:hypothetical protein